MKAYKISARITALTCGNGWNAFGDEELRSYKEFFYLQKEDALKNISDYIDVCSKRGIHISPKKTKDKDCMVWSAKTRHYHTYEVRLEEINVKETY